MACTPSANICYQTQLSPPTFSACHRPFCPKVTHRTRYSPWFFSVELRFGFAPKDLMKKFVDTLSRLPNLRRLDLLCVRRRACVTLALERKGAIFPNIREMIIDDRYPDFIKSCPNLESLTVGRFFTDSVSQVIELYGAGLKRVTGVNLREYAIIYGELVAHNLRDQLTWNRRPFQNYNTVLPKSSGDRACL